MFGIIEAVFPIMFIVVFCLVIGTFVMTAVRGVSTWHRNNQSPRLTVDAQVVAKRTEVYHHTHHDANGMDSHHSSTSYFATFQVASGDRMELPVPRSEYGYLVEGDQGELSFQGTRFLGFQRH